MPGPFDFAGMAGEASDVIDKMVDRQRHDAAFNALQKIYGPIAGDPDTAKKLQEYNYNALADPLKIKGLEQELTGGETKNAQAALDLKSAQGQAAREAGFRALSALQAGVKPDGSLDAGAFDRILTPDLLNMLGVDPAHAATLRAAVTQPGGKQALDIIEQAMLAPSPVTGAPTVIKNQDGSYAFAGRNRYGQIATQDLPAGTTPVMAAAAETRALTGEANSVTGAYRARTTANNSAFGADPNAAVPMGNPPGPAPSTVTPPAASNIPDTSGLTGGIPNKTLDKMVADKGGIDAAIAATADLKMPKPQQDRMAKALADRFSAVQAAAHPAVAAKPASVFDKLPLGSRVRADALASAQQIANQHTTLNNMHSILDSIIPKITPYTASVGAWTDVIPGGALDVKENLDALRSQGFLTALAGMKNAKGQTGIGRVLQSEVPMLQKAYASLEQKQSVPQLLFHLKLFRQSVDQIFAHTRSAFTNQWGTSPESTLGLNDDGSAPSAGGPAAKPGTPTTTPSMNYDPKTGLIK